MLWPIHLTKYLIAFWHKCIKYPNICSAHGVPQENKLRSIHGRKQGTCCLSLKFLLLDFMSWSYGNIKMNKINQDDIILKQLYLIELIIFPIMRIATKNLNLKVNILESNNYWTFLLYDYQVAYSFNRFKKKYIDSLKFITVIKS